MILLSIDIQKEFSTGTQKVPAVLGEQNGSQLGGDGGGEKEPHCGLLYVKSRVRSP